MAKKLYYKIGEACKRLDIQPYVLRYWETEFPVLTPSKSTSGQRVYSEQDLRVIQRIKELLYEEGYTIAGAKKKLDKEDLSSLGELKAIPQSKPKAASKAKKETEPAAEEAKEPKAEKASKSKGAKSTKGKKKSTKPAASTKPKGGAKASAGPSEAKLRKGIRDALKEARGILDLLDS